MKKLIARRPILYMGRTYARGETLPAYDTKMVAAWLRAGSAAQSGQEMPENAGANAESGELAMVTAHLDAADLEKWKKGDLEKLAKEMGVDISKARNNTERAAILAAVEVHAPANEDDDGEATPEPDAEIPV